MTFAELIKTTPDWMHQGGPQGDIVLTSRIRFARNLELKPFPGWAKKQLTAAVLEELQLKVESLQQASGGFSASLSTLKPNQKLLLVEKHLISKEHAARSEGAAVDINPSQTLSIMINEEDHLRMQSILPGFNLRKALAELDAVDDAIESTVSYAFHDTLGYLTSCPTNLGTGMRASAMLHLPGLVLTEQVNQVIQGVNKLGLAVRGLYGEGSEALANLFQISNQQTLGEREADLIARLERVVEQVITHERNARQKLQEDQPLKVSNQVARAYAILRYAHLLESKEALTHLSMMRMGADLGIFPQPYAAVLDGLLVDIQPAHLQHRKGTPLNPAERDSYRAQYLREKLRDFPEPVTLS